MLLLIVCSPVTRRRTSAAIRFSGIPQSPKPPSITVEPEAISATASSADETTLFMNQNSCAAEPARRAFPAVLLGLRRKGKGSHAVPRLPRLQLRRRKRRMIRRIGKMLRLQTQSGVLHMPFLSLPVLRPIQEIAGIKLPPRLRRGHRQHTPARRIVDPPRSLHLAILL